MHILVVFTIFTVSTINSILQAIFLRLICSPPVSRFDRRGVTRVVIRNGRTNNKRRVNTFVYEEPLIINNFSEIYFLKTNKGKVKTGKILSKHE